MEELVVRTEVYVPPEEAFAFLRSFTRYAEYTDYLVDVRQDGPGGVGTEYELTARWWRITGRARTRVTAIEPPERIEWHVIDVLDARGVWELDPTDNGTGVTLVMEYDPGSADTGAISLPRFVSVGWVIERVKPLLRREAKAVVERIVADLEGEPRAVDLEIATGRSA